VGRVNALHRVVLAQVPVRNALLLSNGQHQRLITRQADAIDAAHALRVAADALLTPQVPAQERLVPTTRDSMDVVVKQGLAHDAPPHPRR